MHFVLDSTFRGHLTKNHRLYSKFSVRYCLVIFQGFFFPTLISLARPLKVRFGLRIDFYLKEA